MKQTIKQYLQKNKGISLKNEAEKNGGRKTNTWFRAGVFEPRVYYTKSETDQLITLLSNHPRLSVAKKILELEKKYFAERHKKWKRAKANEVKKYYYDKRQK